VRAVVRTLRAKLPTTKILLLAIFPRGEKPTDPQRLAIVEINRSLASFGDGKFIQYLDLGPQFLNADGIVSKDAMPDFLHPNQRGYKIGPMPCAPG